MQVSFKTLTGLSFQIDCNNESTVANIKKQISFEKGESDFPLERVTLIYDGKKRSDDETFEDLNFDPKKYIVVMIDRKELGPAVAENSGLTPNIEPGCYIMSNATADMSAATEFTAGSNETDISVELGDRDENPFDFMRDHPDFGRFRDLVRAQPSLIPWMLQQMTAVKPDLLNMLSVNPDGFLALLEDKQPAQDVDDNNPQPTQQEEVQSQTMELTETEREAVERLMSLGFSETEAIEAFIACEKNEMLAANYLFDRRNVDTNATTGAKN
ncbi:XPC-binding domain-containing protein [Ditylenchus destructor]|uniref:UV excision repair protein RAD23 n=1 Tax=Ditylenchus destructor TaxID=166010 RepID=A0AAD4NBK1_9BILA|nr:XPC-binding domain-containing protein [Ditylenchus destructor]